MNLSLQDDEQLIVDSVTELAAKSLVEHSGAWDDARRLPAAIIAELGAAGLFGMSIREDLGGVALSNVARAAVLQALAAGDASLAWLVAMHDGLATGHMLAAGTDAQQAAWFPRWATGEPLVVWCEPGPITTARRAGAHWVLDGATAPTVGAALAQRFIVNVATPEGALALLVRREDAGVSVGEAIDRLGARASGVAVVDLAGVQIPEDAQIGGVGEEPMRAVLRARHRVGLAAMACGVGHAALAAAARYATEREQFGRRIADFQAIKFKVADAAMELEAAQLLTARAAWSLDVGSDDLEPASQAKTMATWAAVRACSEALQIHGGAGYTREFAVERHLRVAKMLQTSDGTNRAARRQSAAAIRERFSPR